MRTLTPGQILDRYVIVNFIANGGMGEVHHAWHKVMGSDVALKLVFRRLILEPDTVERFMRRVPPAAKLKHEQVSMDRSNCLSSRPWTTRLP